jgi:hypothetical protein
MCPLKYTKNVLIAFIKNLNREKWICSINEDI